MLNIHMKRKSYTILRTIRRTLAYDSNMVVSNHFHSVNILLFSSARSSDFDVMYSTGLPVSMYTTQTPIDMCRLNVRSILTFSVKHKYQLNYFICIKDFNIETINSLTLFFFLSLFAAVSIMKGKRSAFIYIFLISDRT